MATPDPANVAPWYLRNINQALELNEDTGQVFVRTGFEGNIIISGNVNIPGNVDAHITEIGTSGALTVPYMPIAGNITIDVGQSVGISGNVNIGTMPNVNANITSGNVTVTQGTSPWVVSGNVNANMAKAHKNLTTKGAEYMTLKEVVRSSRDAYTMYQKNYEAALIDAKKELNFHNIVSPPLVPEKKDSPKRAIVIILFTLSAMLIAIVSAVYIEQYRDKLKSQLQ